jgi:hypothetical protein
LRTTDPTGQCSSAQKDLGACVVVQALQYRTLSYALPKAAEVLPRSLEITGFFLLFCLGAPQPSFITQTLFQANYFRGSGFM